MKEDKIEDYLKLHNCEAAVEEVKEFIAFFEGGWYQRIVQALPEWTNLSEP